MGVGSRSTDEPRQSKRSREVLDVLMIDAGRSILREEGVATTSANVACKRVYEGVDRDAGLCLTNASVIRLVWENHAEFQADVLVAVAHERGRPEIERMTAALPAVFDGLDFSTVESRVPL
jgi:hypothetical protein